MVRPRLTN